MSTETTNDALDYSPSELEYRRMQAETLAKNMRENPDKKIQYLVECYGAMKARAPVPRVVNDVAGVLERHPLSKQKKVLRLVLERLGIDQL